MRGPATSMVMTHQHWIFDAALSCVPLWRSLTVALCPTRAWSCRYQAVPASQPLLATHGHRTSRTMFRNRAAQGLARRTCGTGPGGGEKEVCRSLNFAVIVLKTRFPQHAAREHLAIVSSQTIRSQRLQTDLVVTSRRWFVFGRVHGRRPSRMFTFPATVPPDSGSIWGVLHE